VTTFGQLQPGSPLFDADGCIVGKVVEIDAECVHIALPGLSSDRPYGCKKEYVRRHQKRIGIPAYLHRKTGLEAVYVEPPR
jgi:hypothetical protein